MNMPVGDDLIQILPTALWTLCHEPKGPGTRDWNFV